MSVKLTSGSQVGSGPFYQHRHIFSSVTRGRAFTPAPGELRQFIVALMSNVLRVNSAWDHARIAAAIERAVRTRAGAAIEDKGTAREIEEAGKGE